MKKLAHATPVYKHYLAKIFYYRTIKVTSLIVLVLIVFTLGSALGSGRLNINSSGQNPQLPVKLDYSSVNQVYNDIRSQYDGKLTTTQLLDGLKSGLAQATGDQYTEYFNTNNAKQFDEELDNSFTGIGAELGDNSSGNLIVIAPINGFPAAKAGLLAQDMITSINGVSTNGLNIDQAVDKIRGPAGTKVTLQIIRNGSEQLTFVITRATITLPTVTSQILTGNIGYMQICAI